MTHLRPEDREFLIETMKTMLVEEYQREAKGKAERKEIEHDEP